MTSRCRGLKNSLADAGYAVCRLNYSSIGQSLQKWKEETTSQIDQCVSGYSTVHFVGHSLGGLAIRSYLANDEQLAQDKRLGKVVLLGTPNKGSEVADSMKGHFLMSIAGEVSQSLTTGEQSLGQRLPPPYYPVGVIAGTSESSGTAELFHSLNDGLVSVESAKVSNMADFITLDVSSHGDALRCRSRETNDQLPSNWSFSPLEKSGIRRSVVIDLDWPAT